MSKSWMSADWHDPSALAAYIDGTLDKDERSAVVSHLARCGDCRVALAEYVKVTTGDAETALRAARPSAVTVWPRIWLPIAATIAVATVASVLQFSSRRTDPAPTASAVTETPLVPAAAAEPAPRPSTGLPPAVAMAPTPSAALPPRRPSPVDEGMMRLRGAERRVGDKRFRLVSGEWIDAAYDPFDVRPVVDVTTPAERAALLGRLPALRPFADLGKRVIVVHAGSVYRFATQ